MAEEVRPTGSRHSVQGVLESLAMEAYCRKRLYGGHHTMQKRDVGLVVLPVGGPMQVGSCQDAQRELATRAVLGQNSVTIAGVYGAWQLRLMAWTDKCPHIFVAQPGDAKVLLIPKYLHAKATDETHQAR